VLTIKTITKDKILEAILVITSGMLVIYLINHRPVFLYIAVGAGVAGIILRPLARWIAFVWYKAGDLLGALVSNVTLALVFFLLLVPVALLYRLFHRDPLRLRKSEGSNWADRGHEYTAGDLKNTW